MRWKHFFFFLIIFYRKPSTTSESRQHTKWRWEGGRYVKPVPLPSIREGSAVRDVAVRVGDKCEGGKGGEDV